MKKPITKVLLTAAICAVGILTASCVKAQEPAAGTNVALDKKVTVDPLPNYSYTRGHNPQLLTDGKYTSSKDGSWIEDVKKRQGHMWTKKGALAWTHKKPVIIEIDLGKVQPISGLIYSTGGGVAGVVWPSQIYIATSDDGQTWHYAGDLMKLSAKYGTPPEGDVSFRYVTHDLKTHGRYVAVGIMQDFVPVTDEVEILRGSDDLLNQSAGEEIPEMKEFAPRATMALKAQNRQNADIAATRNLIDASNLNAAQKSTFNARLDKDATATNNMELLPVDFKTIIPITATHCDILAVHGEALAAQGFAPLTVWKKHRYAWLPIIHQPDKMAAATLNFSVLRNQFRSDSVLLTNASGKPMTATITLQNAPKNAQNGWLQLDSAIWTDTYNNTAVQDALIPMEQKDGVYTLEIPAGITAKIWATLNSSKLPAGSYKSTFAVKGAGQNITVPLNIDIAKIAMSAPRMSLTTWDYTDGKGGYGITPENREAAIKLMRSHFLDSPWAKGWVLPTPKATDFDANNQLINELDFSTFKEWLKMWPGVHNYMIFRNIRDTDDFAGAKMDTPEFDAKIASWIKATVKAAESVGVEPSKLVICPVDETRNDSWDLHLLNWGKAIKRADSRIRLFSDPIWRNPKDAKYPEAYEFVDILSPHPNWEDDFYVKAAHKNPHQELWLYNGPGLNSTGDPQLAYRQMAWRVFEAGGNGMGFWAFADLSGAKSSWNTYTATKLIYAPVFFNKDTVTNSVHWDAVRDGVEDFEELSMLKDAIAKSNNSQLKAQAQALLDNAVKAANTIPSLGSVDDDKGIYNWNRNIDPTTVDAQLVKVRAMLERF